MLSRVRLNRVAWSCSPFATFKLQRNFDQSVLDHRQRTQTLSLGSQSADVTSSASALNLPAYTRNMSAHAESAVRPAPDQVIQDIADYVLNYKITSELAYETARLCLIDTIGCGLEG
jgi:hypothetical protein